jgi:hypothetical protein
VQRKAVRYNELIAAGVVRPKLESGDLVVTWPEIELPQGTAAELIDIDRGA